MSPQVKAFYKSICTVLGVAAGCGTGAGLIFKSTSIGIGVGLILLVAQFLVGYIASIRRDQKQEVLAQDIINGVMNGAQELRVPIVLSCAYCNMQNRVPLSLMEDNSFECVSCNQPNKVYMQFSTVRVTQPLSSKIEIREVNDEPTQRQTTINEPIQLT